MPAVRRDQKVNKRKALEVNKEAKLRLEKEKTDYMRQRDEEVQRILLLKAEVDSGKKDLEEEYQNLVKRRDERRDETKDFDLKLREYEKEAEELDGMEVDEEDINPGGDGEEKSNPGGGGLFVKNEPSDGDDDIDVENIVTSLDQLRLASGDRRGGRVIAWKPVGSRGKQVITRLGPGKTPRLRIEKASEVNDAWDEEKVPKITRLDARYGQMKNNDGQYLYKYGDLVGIIGVAWVYGDHEEHPEELLKPKDRKNLPKRENDSNRQALYPQTQIWLLWRINGELKKSWEVRNTIHRLWKKESKGDEVIYIKAKEQEDRYQAYLRRERATEEGTPKPLPGGDSPSPSPGPQGQSGSDNPFYIKKEETENPVETEQEKARKKAMSADARDEYLKEWCQARGYDPDTLLDHQMKMFLRAWRVEEQSGEL